LPQTAASDELDLKPLLGERAQFTQLPSIMWPHQDVKSVIVFGTARTASQHASLKLTMGIHTDPRLPGIDPAFELG